MGDSLPVSMGLQDCEEGDLMVNCDYPAWAYESCPWLHYNERFPNSSYCRLRDCCRSPGPGQEEDRQD